METWVEKYRPKALGEVIGNPKAVNDLNNWVEIWKTGVPEKRAALLYGPPGTGKTSSAYAMADEMGLDFIELNASDSRTKDIITRIVGSASSSGTLDPERKGKIIIIDEVDNVHGKSDYGGLNAIKNCMKASLQPMVLIANDPWSLPKDFRALCLMIEFKKVDKRSILKLLKEICRKEGIKKTDERVLKIVATNANGDLRSAINDLQALSEGNEQLRIEDANVLSMRDVETKIFNTIAQILKTQSCDRAREAMWDSNEQPETIFNWIVENVPLEYEDPGDLARAFNYISRADVFMGRIMRRQDWSLLGYAVDMMSAGVATAKRKRYSKFTRYQYPRTFALYARTRKKKALMDSIAGRISEKCHVSKRIARDVFFPLLEIAMKSGQMAPVITSDLEMTLEEIEFFVEDKKAAKSTYSASEEIKAARIKEGIRRGGGKQISLFEFGGDQ